MTRVMPRVWRLPFGAKVEIEYVDAVELEPNLGEWHGWDDKGVGHILIARAPADEMLDTLYHEMIHVLPDWHSHYIRPAQRQYQQELIDEAKIQAEEEAA